VAAVQKLSHSIDMNNNTILAFLSNQETKIKIFVSKHTNLIMLQERFHHEYNKVQSTLRHSFMGQEGRRRILNYLNFQLQNEVGEQGQNTTLRSRQTLKCRLMFLLCFMTQLHRLQNVELEDAVNDELEGMKKETTVTYFKICPGPRAYTYQRDLPNAKRNSTRCLENDTGRKGIRVCIFSFAVSAASCT
jgi:hypothetical protein